MRTRARMLLTDRALRWPAAAFVRAWRTWPHAHSTLPLHATPSCRFHLGRTWRRAAHRIVLEFGGLCTTHSRTEGRPLARRLVPCTDTERFVCGCNRGPVRSPGQLCAEPGRCGPCSKGRYCVRARRAPRSSRMDDAGTPRVDTTPLLAHGPWHVGPLGMPRRPCSWPDDRPGRRTCGALVLAPR